MLCGNRLELHTIDFPVAAKLSPAELFSHTVGRHSLRAARLYLIGLWGGRGEIMTVCHSQSAEGENSNDGVKDGDNRPEN